MRRLLCLLTLLLAACSNAPSGYAALPPNGNAESGKAIFEQGIKNAQACSSCHAIDWPPEVGPSLKGIASNAASRVPGQSADEYLYNAIVRPNDYLVAGYAAGVMPTNYGDTFSPQQIRNVIAYLLTVQ